MLLPLPRGCLVINPPGSMRAARVAVGCYSHFPTETARVIVSKPSLTSYKIAGDTAQPRSPRRIAYSVASRKMKRFLCDSSSIPAHQGFRCHGSRDLLQPRKLNRSCSLRQAQSLFLRKPQPFLRNHLPHHPVLPRAPRVMSRYRAFIDLAWKSTISVSVSVTVL